MLLPGDSSGLSVLRAFRLLRLFKLAKSIKSVRVLMGTVASSIGHIKYMALLMFFFIFMFACLGLELFYGEYSDRAKYTLRLRFQSVYWAHISVFSFLTLNNWVEHMILMAETTNAAAPWVYALIVTMLGNYIIYYMCVSACAARARVRGRTGARAGRQSVARARGRACPRQRQQLPSIVSRHAPATLAPRSRRTRVMLPTRPRRAPSAGSLRSSCSTSAPTTTRSSRSKTPPG